MVRLLVLAGAMLGTGLMGLGVGYWLGHRSLTIETKAGGASTPPICSVEAPAPVGDMNTPATPNHPWKTIRVLRFKVRGGQANLTAGAESALTEAVVRRINITTPYKAILDGDADTELTGAITDFCCREPPGDLREGSDTREMEMHLVVEWTWRDLRTGKSLQAQKNGSRPAAVELRSVAYYRPEIGDSIEITREENLDRTAKQIVSLIDTSW